ncbi:TetR family transcriptional regulator [Lacibacterium aquatile]|uniref:TetR family transcriptional regulator n=1 Tax=Lacibacterium aquatile TaxID=1168082 RepID=A0ABW5DXJ8_9PROT
MARVSKEQSQKNRETILQVAAGLFRERGLAGIGVADLMAAAGLTHGGFYGHFASKDDLAAEAAGRAFDEVSGMWKSDAAFEASVTQYLSAEHRDAPDKGCPMAALAADVAREGNDKPIRAVFQKGIAETVEALSGLQADGRKGALVDLAALIGALTLARATKGDAISDEILAAVRERLLGNA